MHNAWRNVDYQKLFVHNIEINSLKAVVYAFNLTASRYLEYSAAIKFAGKLKPEDLVLEVGCGHSILPTLWQEVGARVVAVDMNRKALKRQLEKSKMISSKYRNKPINPVVASIENLPFRDVYSVVSCISTIEHIPDEGDIRASREIGNVLKNNGLNITSLPLSTFERSITQRDYSVGIPVIFSKFFKSILKTIYYKFRVDRTESYFERYYCAADVNYRVIAPSECKLEGFEAFQSPRIMKLIHGKVIPIGISAVFEYFLAQAFKTTYISTRKMDAVVLKLRKQQTL